VAKRARVGVALGHDTHDGRIPEQNRSLIALHRDTESTGNALTTRLGEPGVPVCRDRHGRTLYQACASMFTGPELTLG
jgi:hypothetical protein